jgi:hypothetical protein
MSEYAITGRNSEEIVGQLRERWQVGKATVYDRLKYLGISIAKANGESFISTKDLHTLDEYNEWLINGNSKASFPRPGALVQTESGDVQQTAATIELEFGDPAAGDALRQLVRVAQEQATGTLIAQNYLTRQFIENPNSLDPDLLEQVKGSEEAIAPKSIDPRDYAKRLIAKHRTIAA